MSPRKGKRRAAKAKEEKQKRLDEEKEAASVIEKVPSSADGPANVETKPVLDEDMSTTGP